MTRQCGSCTLCCKLLPVRDNLVGIDKDAGVRCRHQSSSKGCKVYHKPWDFPVACGMWSCRWLVDPETEGLRRPDRSHYVVDIIPDEIIAEDTDRPEIGQHRFPVIQVWRR